MITMSLGWGALAALIAWSAFVFWLGRRSAGNPGGHDLSGPPPSLTMPRAAAAAPAPVMNRAPAGLAPDALVRISDEIARGNKIQAIKLLRDATGMGLAEAKHAVEAMGG